MIKAKQQQINDERVSLFHFLWAELEKESQEILTDCRRARNLACSEWISFNGEIVPFREKPERTDLLNKVYNQLVELNSRRKYFLIETFLPTLKKLKVSLSTEQNAVYQYWQKELTKEDPELENRFKPATGN
jgi:hemerythrin-like domain-containing protein